MNSSRAHTASAGPYRFTSTGSTVRSTSRVLSVPRPGGAVNWGRSEAPGAAEESAAVSGWGATPAATGPGGLSSPAAPAPAATGPGALGSAGGPVAAPYSAGTASSYSVLS